MAGRSLLAMEKFESTNWSSSIAARQRHGIVHVGQRQRFRRLLVRFIEQTVIVATIRSRSRQINSPGFDLSEGSNITSSTPEEHKLPIDSARRDAKSTSRMECRFQMIHRSSPKMARSTSFKKPGNANSIL